MSRAPVARSAPHRFFGPSASAMHACIPLCLAVARSRMRRPDHATSGETNIRAAAQACKLQASSILSIPAPPLGTRGSSRSCVCFIRTSPVTNRPAITPRSSFRVVPSACRRVPSICIHLLRLRALQPNSRILLHKASGKYDSEGWVRHAPRRTDGPGTCEVQQRRVCAVDIVWVAGRDPPHR